MKYYRLLFTFASLLFFVGISTAQEEQKAEVEKVKKEKVDKKKEKVKDTAEVMKPKVAEFQEPAFAMDIEQGAKANSTGIHNAYSVEILDADKKVVDKAWKSLMKSYKGRTKYNRKEAELGTTSAKVLELGSAVYSIKASIEQRGGNVILHSWFEGTDGYVDDTTESEDAGVVELLNSFATSVRKDMVKLSLDMEEKTLKQSESQLTKLKRQNDSYYKAIETAKRKIAEAEQNIIENDAAQEIEIAKIDGQRSIVEGVRQRLKRIN